MHVLLVKTSSLGDVVHNLPMVTDMAAMRPGIVIDWLVEPAFADIPAMHPAIHSVIPADIRRWRRAPWDRETWRGVKELRARLTKTRYDLILDTQGLVKSALVARLAQGPLYGPDRRSAREPLAATLYARGLAMSRDRHAVWRNRMLGAGALGYPLPATMPDYGLTMTSAGHTGEPVCVAFHASSRASKLWPPRALGDAREGALPKGLPDPAAVGQRPRAGRRHRDRRGDRGPGRGTAAHWYKGIGGPDRGRADDGRRGYRPPASGRGPGKADGRDLS